MYYFEDELQYLPRNWQYCTDADRRFWSEQQFGIAFSQYPQLTDAGEQDTRSIPYGTYDMGDCYLSPKDNKLYNYDVSRAHALCSASNEARWNKREIIHSPPSPLSTHYTARSSSLICHPNALAMQGTYYRDPTPEELTWAKRKARLGLDKPDQSAASQ